MNEATWLSSNDPQAMLKWLTARGTTTDRHDPRAGRVIASDRKLRLFACACLDLRAKEHPEWHSEGFAEDRHSARPIGSELAWAEAWAKVEKDDAVSAALRAALLRDIFGNPWRPIAPVLVECEHCDEGQVRNDIDCGKPGGSWGDCQYCDESGMAAKAPDWATPTVIAVAQGIYDRRTFGDMPILGDSLEEAHCTSEELLQHCRGWERCPYANAVGLVWYHGSSGRCVKCNESGWVPMRSPHVRGCHVLDAILGLS